MFIKPRIAILLLLAIAQWSTGCKKQQDIGVPITSVDININLNLPEYIDLAVVGGWVYLTGGSQGLIVYRKGTDEFTALDRHCTYQPENLCRVTVDGSGVMARDTTCCGSAFLLMDGSVVEGPAAIGLKSYHTTYNGTYLHIFN